MILYPSSCSYFFLVCNVLPVVVSSEQLVINIENKPEKNQVEIYNICTYFVQTVAWYTAQVSMDLVNT